MLRTSDKNFEVGPSSADSANSHHFFFSRVQNAKGMALKEWNFLLEMRNCYCSWPKENLTPSLLETKDVDFGQSCRLDDGCHSLVQSIPLIQHFLARSLHDAILHQTDASDARASRGFSIRLKTITGQLKILLSCQFLSGRTEGQLPRQS